MDTSQALRWERSEEIIGLFFSIGKVLARLENILFQKHVKFA